MHKSMRIGTLGVWILMVAFSFPLLAQDIQEGKQLFLNNCAQCHAKDMKTGLTGPALVGFQERWADYPREDLYRWIRNSQAMIAEGHPRAEELWDEWGPTIMNSFSNFTDEQIESIIAYVDAKASGELDKDAAANGAAVAVEETDNTTLFLVLLVILLVLAFIMARIINVLNSIAHKRETGEPAPRYTVKDFLTSKTVISLALFALIVLGGYTTVNRAVMLGRQQGYQPEQPIWFSHEIHAGIQQIDCQFCHDGARRSKLSVIPSTNTCMNCHRAIKKGTITGTQEITKIFASIGYDPISDNYLESYDSLTRDSVANIYKAWIAQEYKKDQGVEEIDARGQREVDTQWENIVASLTNDQKEKVQGAVEWIRVHNLPDHVYFNHAQHVTAGQIECQTCHGKVEEMEVLSQYAPLSMGWCINCHRQTEVSGFDENPYYLNTYKKYHEQMTAGGNKVTVEDIGGLECQKCHY